MRLVDILRSHVIRTDLDAGDRWQAIAELMDLMVASHDVRLTDRRRLLSLVQDRERSMTTGLGEGIANPPGDQRRRRGVRRRLGHLRRWDRLRISG